MTVQISDWQGSTAARVLNPHSAWEEVCEVGGDVEEGEEGEGEEERGPVLSQPERVLSLVSRDWTEQAAAGPQHWLDWLTVDITRHSLENIKHGKSTS